MLSEQAKQVFQQNAPCVVKNFDALFDIIQRKTKNGLSAHLTPRVRKINQFHKMIGDT